MNILSNMCLWMSEESSVPVTQRTPNLGVLAPLFLIATKCRDLQIRHEAIDLMHSAKRSERGWNSCIASTLARFVASIEDSQGSQDIQHSAKGYAVLSGNSQSKLYVSLDKVDLDPTSNRMIVFYQEQRISSNGQISRRTAEAILPYRSQAEAVPPMVDPLSAKVLRSYGYTGVLLMAPELPQCQCLWHEPEYIADHGSPAAQNDNSIDWKPRSQGGVTRNVPGTPKWFYDQRVNFETANNPWLKWRSGNLEARSEVR